MTNQSRARDWRLGVAAAAAVLALQGNADAAPKASPGKKPAAPAASAPAAAAAASPAATAAPAGALTYEAALQATLARSLDEQRAALAIELAAADTAVLSYENDPSLALSGSWSDYRPKDKDAVRSPSGSGGSGQSYLAGINATLYDFGRHSARMRQSQAAKDVKTLAKDEVSDTLRYAVARAYLTVLASERIVVIAGTQVDVSAKKLADQQANYRKGLRPEGDVVTAQVDLGRSKLVLETARDDARLARVALAQLMGVPVEEIMGAPLPADTLSFHEPVPWQRLVDSWSGFGKSATDARREREKSALAEDEDLVHATKRPVLSAGVNAGRAGVWGAEQNNLYTGQVQLSWDVPWNGMSRDEIRRIGLRRQDLDLQDQQDQKTRRDRDAAARETFRAGTAQWDALSSQVKLATRQKELVDRRYETGKASAFEVSTAETDLLTSQLDLIKLQNALALSLIDIAQARAVTELGGVFK